MDVEQQKQVFLKTIKHIDDLNELMQISNNKVDAKLIAESLNSKKIDLNSKNMNIYLASLLLLVFYQKEIVIKLSIEDINKVMILNYINTILEELNLKQLEFEMI